MGKLVWSTNFTLDGVVQDPDGLEDFERGGWFREYGGADLEVWAKIEFEEAMNTSALLLGRRSDEWFASRWAERDDDWANRLNAMPKYVVSTTLDEAKWQNSSVLNGDPAAEVATLKHQVDGDIVLYGSYTLGQTLLEKGLIDELRLFLFPVVIGSGRRLFGDTADKTALRLTDTRHVGDGLILLTFAVTQR